MTHSPPTKPDSPDVGAGSPQIESCPEDPSQPAVTPEPQAVADEKAEPTTVQTLRCRSAVEGQYQQLNYIRNLPPFTLEGRLTPARDDAAPTPSEALLAALGACLGVAIQAMAMARVITIKRLELAIEADCDPSAGWRVVGVDGPKSMGFEAVRVSVHIEADAPRNVLETLVANAVLWSPVCSTIHDPVHLDVALA